MRMFFLIKFFMKVYFLVIFCCSYVKSQLYNQNATIILPYPYQTTLGLPGGQGSGIQNYGVQPAGSFPYPYLGNNLAPAQIPNTTLNYNNYFATLAQQGRPAYPYPQGYPQPGFGYPQPGIGQTPPGFGYPPIGPGYMPQGYGQSYQSGGYGFAYPRTGYPYQDAYPPVGQGTGQQRYYGRMPDPYSNIKTEILDVSPEYHRQFLGLPSTNTLEGTKIPNSDDKAEGTANQGSQNIQPRYDIKVDSKTSNFTSIPSNLSQPIITSKKFTTTIRRTFVYDSSKPDGTKAVNLHLINGKEVTTTPPPTTTQSEDVEDHTGVTIKGRRFMDVPATCPKGTQLAHNGKCIAPFFAASLGLPETETVTNITTQSPTQDEDDI